MKTEAVGEQEDHPLITQIYELPNRWWCLQARVSQSVQICEISGQTDRFRAQLGLQSQ
jgi:hypothetical protein